jgi:hypothetical protein
MSFRVGYLGMALRILIRIGVVIGSIGRAVRRRRNRRSRGWRWRSKRNMLIGGFPHCISEGYICPELSNIFDKANGA